jgi:hypothetical protein
MAAANAATTTWRPEYPFWRGGRHLADPLHRVPNESSVGAYLVTESDVGVFVSGQAYGSPG